MATRHDVSNLERRGHTFYWRARVPTRFRQVRRHARLFFSLRLSDHHKAAYMARRLNTLLADLAALIVVLEILTYGLGRERVRDLQASVTIDVVRSLILDGKIDAALAAADAIAHVTDQRVKIAEGVDPVPGKCGAIEADAALVEAVVFGERCFQISTELTPPSRTVLNLVLFPFVVCVVAGFLASALLARHLAKPIMILKSGLGALAAGDLTRRIGGDLAGYQDAMSELAHDFDATATKLEALQATQQRLYHDISHELRSPLTRLQVELGALRQKPDRASSMIARMQTEIERLDALVEQILTLAKLDATAAPPFQRQRIDVADLLEAIVEDATIEGLERNLSVELDSATPFVAVVDGELLYRAFENVIRNALKYSERGGIVFVRSSLDPQGALVVVSDDGPSVATGDRERMFRPFVRVGNQTAIGGHGLGVAIAQRAIEIHGGRIRAEDGPDGGLAVIMELPPQDDLRQAVPEDISNKA